jgi:SAM-dependent methyltransferase
MSVANPFATAAMAAGYAKSRPPVHPRVIDLVRARLPRIFPVRRALDVGCGAGLSTRALYGLTGQCIGLEPAISMLSGAAEIAPGALFLGGAAEALPFQDRSIDLITAAGSLNYAPLDRFFPEADRVLAPRGALLVYDFRAGSRFRDDDTLERWFDEFNRLYPPPAGEGRPLSPEILARIDRRFRVDYAEQFTIGITLDPAFYLDYMMTETNVAAAVRRGVPIDEIRGWSANTLAPVWQGRSREVFFQGYYACMVRATR